MARQTDRDDEAGSDVTVKRRSGFKAYMVAQIDTKWADGLLLLCFFCSGLVDSMAFNMYGCFVSMQTGTDGDYFSLSPSLPPSQTSFSQFLI